MNKASIDFLKSQGINEEKIREYLERATIAQRLTETISRNLSSMDLSAHCTVVTALLANCAQRVEEEAAYTTIAAVDKLSAQAKDLLAVRFPKK